MVFETAQNYNDPIGGTESDVGNQMNEYYWQRRALVDAAKETFFGAMADVTNMPKHYGKTIKKYHYLPILDDRNNSTQGIDADGISTGAAFSATNTYVKQTIKLVAPAARGGMSYYFSSVATGANIAAAKTAADNEAEGKVWAYAVEFGYPSTSYADAKTNLEAGGWTVTKVASTDDLYSNFGNLYGSNKDVGTITAKIPSLTENGGRVNRVGMKRIQLSATISKFGFFDEYTQESLDFDTDAELLGHITGESVKAANEITEDQIQIDLLNGAGVVRFTGDATSAATLAGSTAAANAEDAVVFDDLVKLSLELDDNRTPKNTKMITGSRMVDTKVVNAARYAFIGSELIPSLMRLTDYHGERAWLPVAKYGAAAHIARGEQGSVHDFRFIQVPEMMHWYAAGATVGNTADEVCRWGLNEAGAAKLNVYPILVVGDGSFTTIGFQTSGKTVKFVITHKPPGKENADRNDPFGETGFYSIKWYYGLMVLRAERLAVLKTVATF